MFTLFNLCPRFEELSKVEEYVYFESLKHLRIEDSACDLNETKIQQFDANC